MTDVRLTRTVHVPDPIRTARCLRAPDLGPTVLFFSGGTALRDLARTLKHYTHRSVHVITPFDSGGSSARLRAAFGMLSVGDLRNRLLALADDSLHGNMEVQQLLAHRLSPRHSDASHELQEMITGEHQLVTPVPAPMRRIVRTHLRMFADLMPADIDLGAASVGNLVLAAGYLNHDGDIDSVLYLFSRLVDARGLVLPVVDAPMHLMARLENGRLVQGQHEITGKDAAPIEAPIVALHLCRSLDAAVPEKVQASPRVLDHIARADLICYPMGSFYTSLVANLLPAGIGAAIRASRAPKVYIPNTGIDAEQRGHSVAACVARLLETLRLDAGTGTNVGDLLNYVLMDENKDYYPGGVDPGEMAHLGVESVTLRLVSAASTPKLDAELLSRTLVSLA